MGRFAIFVIAMALALAMLLPSRPQVARNSGETPDEHKLVVDQAKEGTPAPVSLDNAAYGETVLTRDGSGQFHLDVGVNGQNLPFLVDTGADIVALTVADARRVGIFVEPNQFYPVGTGAGGELKGQLVKVDRLRVAGHELTDVDAIVVDGLATNLLGQSVLRRFGKVELAGDRMTIR